MAIDSSACPVSWAEIKPLSEPWGILLSLLVTRGDTIDLCSHGAFCFRGLLAKDDESQRLIRLRGLISCLAGFWLLTGVLLCFLPLPMRVEEGSPVHLAPAV